jgi:hypothetical protein
MRLISRFQHKQPELSDTEVSQIRERVRNMRDEIGRREVELADLFSLVQEDERPVLREMREVHLPEPERFWPDQIPSSKPAPESQAAYGGWQGAPQPDLARTP